MAKYAITNSCGHSRSYQLYGPGKDRERKTAWLRTVPCPDCKEAPAAEAKPDEALVARYLESLRADPDPEGAIRDLLAEMQGPDVPEHKRALALAVIDRYREAV